MKTYSSFQKIIVIILLAALLISLVFPIMSYVVFADELDNSPDEIVEPVTEEKKYSSFDMLKNNITSVPVEVKQTVTDLESMAEDAALKGTAYPDPDSNMERFINTLLKTWGLIVLLLLVSFPISGENQDSFLLHITLLDITVCANGEVTATQT